MVRVEELKSLLEKAFKIDKSIRNTILQAWRQGTEVKLPVSSWEDFIINKETTLTLLSQALQTLEESLWDGYFTIRSPRAVYGTGKSQLAWFIFFEAEKREIPARFYSLTSDPRSIDEIQEFAIDFIRSLKKPKKSKRKTCLIIIDEVDLLMRAGMKEEQLRIVLEKLANATLSIRNYAKNHKVNLALILVLSKQIDDKINELSSDRLGRRLTTTLAEVDYRRTEELFEEILCKVATLMTAHKFRDKYKRNINVLLDSLRSFIEDTSRLLYTPTELSKKSVGELIATSVNILETFLAGLDIKKWKRERGRLHDYTYLAGAIEEILKEYIANKVPRLEYIIQDVTMTAEFDPKPVTVKNFKSDGAYKIYVGKDKLLGHALIEITLSEKISSTYKLDQLKAFLSYSPVILIYCYPSTREEAEDEIATIYEDATNEIFPVLLHRELIKYVYYLERKKIQYPLQYISKIYPHIDDELQQYLKKILARFCHEWLSIAPTTKIPQRTSLVETPIVKQEQKKKIPLNEFKRRLISAIKASLSRLQFDRVSFRSITTIEKVFNEEINNVLVFFDLPAIDEKLNAEIVHQILKHWAKEGLGKLTKTRFKPFNSRNLKHNPAWNDEKAAKIVFEEYMTTLASHLSDILEIESI